MVVCTSAFCPILFSYPKAKLNNHSPPERPEQPQKACKFLDIKQYQKI